MGNKFDLIVPGIYQGNIDGARDKEGLKGEGITHILSLRDNPHAIYPDDFVYKLIDAEDMPNQDLSKHFEECVYFIHECLLSGGKVMIHCMAGVSRSTTATCVYLMTASSQSMDTVLASIKARREIAGPNEGFMSQLRNYEKKNLREARIKLRAKHPQTDSLKLDEKLLEAKNSKKR